jgi:hypothetical protein
MRIGSGLRVAGVNFIWKKGRVEGGVFVGLIVGVERVDLDGGAAVCAFGPVELCQVLGDVLVLILMWSFG